MPEIGLLRLVRTPAEKSYQENRLGPPGLKIILEASHRPTKADYPIEEQIARSQGIPIDEAREAWTRTAELIREKLSTGSSVSLSGLGILNIGDEGQISFADTHVPTSLYEPLSVESLKKTATKQPEASKGQLPIAEAPSSDTEAMSPEAEPVPSWEAIREEEGRKRPDRQPRSRWWIAGSIVALLLVAWFTYKGTMQRRQRRSKIEHILTKENTPSARDLSDMDSEQLKSDTLSQHPAASDSIHYDIVFASYNNKDRALHQYRKMRNWGHPVVLYTQDSIIYKLAMPFTSLPDDTTVNLVNMMKLYGGKTYIEYNSGQ